MVGANRGGGSHRPRLLAIDGDEAVALNWSRLLSDHVEMASASTFEAAWQATDSNVWRSERFDYVFLDLQLRDGSGADLLDRLNALEPRPGVAVISGWLDARLALAIYGRCSIVVPKPVDREVLLGVLAILEEARSGGSLIETFASEYQLSPQETRLLLAASREATNEEAADELGCTHATVRSYWRRIFDKTGCGSAREVMTQLFRFSLAPRAQSLLRASSRPPPSSHTRLARPSSADGVSGTSAKEWTLRPRPRAR